MNRIYVPASNADQWAPLLADPGKQWQKGYSARTLAHSWQSAEGFPQEVMEALATSGVLCGAEMLLALPEHQVPLPGGARPTQSDIWVLSRVGAELASIAVEGKVDEPFGPTLGEWLNLASSGKEERLSFLMEQLEIPRQPPPEIRYQLLHRSASAIIEAKRFNAKHAVMLVHSFSSEDRWFDDFGAFAKLFNIQAQVGIVGSAPERGNIQLHLLWVRGNSKFPTV